MTDARTEARLPPLEPDQFDPAQRAYYEELLAGPRGQGPYRRRLVDDRGRLLGPYNARLLDPEVGRAIQQVATTLRFRSRISARWREMAILTVAVAERSGHEWEGHIDPARQAGLSADELEALASGSVDGVFHGDDRLVLRVVAELIRDRDLSDGTFADAERSLGPAVVFDLVSLVGHYQHTALALRVWKVGTGDVSSAQTREDG